MAAVMGSFADASAAAHLPAPLAVRIADIATARGAVTAFRLEGVGPSVVHRKALLETLAAPYGAVGALEAAASHALWRAIRDVAPFAANGPPGTRDLWRISTAPSRGAEIGRTLAQRAQAEILL